MSASRIIETAELRQRVDAGPIEHFWNVVVDEYYTGELIPGSRRVPLPHVGQEVRRLGIPTDAEIVVYCNGPKCPNSAQAAEKLEAFGYTNVLVFKGGLEEWKAASLPVERDPAAASTGSVAA
jgi:rhodanese-related sulfurtransferase